MSIRKIKKNLAEVYRQRRLEADLRGARNKEAVRRARPELKQLELDLAEGGAALLQAMTGPATPDKAEKIARATAVLEQKKQKRLDYLKQHGIASDYDQPRWTCAKCHDEGYVDGKPCSCYEQAYLPLLRAYLNLDRLDGMTFATWRSDLFPDQAVPGEASQRVFMDRLCERMQAFTRDFTPGPQANLLFTGATGTGKTFLLGCLANELERQGHLVLYLSAPRLLQELAQYRKLKNSFSPDPDRLEEASELYDLILHVPCLIIDDLGTESEAAGTRLSEWLQLLNYRCDRTGGKTTFISTNLSRKALQAMYDERLLSRLMGLFVNIHFPGADIRLFARYGPVRQDRQEGAEANDG